VTRTVSISLNQFYRPQPGGIATYVRGLVGGLVALHEDSLRLIGIEPRGLPVQDVSDLAIERVRAPASIRFLTRAWARWPLGVPPYSDVVHATSLAGPFAGGREGAVHCVALHDLLWRDEPSTSTPRGVRFHERRLQMLKQRHDIRVFATAPGLAERLIAEGFAPSRLHEVRLGVDEAVPGDSPDQVRAFLAEHGVHGPFTLYAGTREPRKNLERLFDAHTQAAADNPALGPLVLVGPQGWGDVDSGGAVVLGIVARSLLRGLYRDAAVVAYVPRAEGWGLPPVEALHEGTRVVASATTPSVMTNDEVVLVDPYDVANIAEGLTRVLSQSNDETARARRRASVATLTWRNVALDHLAGWQ
jgi:glycosyltransferase involved in cell wall biosynthesis